MSETPIDPAATPPQRTFVRGAMLGFARGSVAGGVIFTWAVAQHDPALATLGVVGTILGSFCQELLS